jgi:hypothetical protein
VSRLFAILFLCGYAAAQQVTVLDLTLPEELAWGVNSARVRIRNGDTQAHVIQVDGQMRNLDVDRGTGRQSTHTIEAGAETVVEHEFLLPPFPGKVRIRFTVTDITAGTNLLSRETMFEFPLATTQRNVWRSGGATYPALAMREQSRFVFYYMPGDRFIESHLDEFAELRDRAYRELAARLNPGFNDRIAVYLFPDAETKQRYTMHQGMGWAKGHVLVEIYNEKEHVDVNHELVHIITQPLGNPPAMFQEGLAAYLQVDHKWAGYDSDAWTQGFAHEGALIPLARILSFTEIGSPESHAAIAYPESASIVKFVTQRFGWNRLLQAYRELKSGQDNTTVFARIFGMPPGEFERQWRQSIQAAEVEPVPPAKLRAAIQAR